MSRRRRSIRQATRLVLIGILALITTFTVVSQADAGQRTVTVINAPGVDYVNIRSAPNTTSTVVRRVYRGQTIGINCWVPGQAVRGPYGSSTIWYTVDGGGFVTDSYIETGSNNAVTGQCGATGFALPFPRGTTHTVTQSPGGSTSHRNEYNSTAVDWAANRGETVVASASGRIYFEGWNGAGGIIVLIDHGNDNCTQYAHLSSTVVDRGWTVQRGQKIGTVGGSGYGNLAYYPTHLHWAGVSCSTQKARFIIDSIERGTSYPAGLRVTSQN